jgi:hypothetical protein
VQQLDAVDRRERSRAYAVRCSSSSPISTSPWRPSQSRYDDAAERVERLRGADVRRRLLAADVLLAGLSVSTKPRLPSTSVVSPAMRPGMRRRYASVAAKKPNDGPPKSRRLPSCWPSPTATSTPHSPGGASTPSVTGSTDATTTAGDALAASASAATSSIAPRKFGFCTKTALVSIEIAAAQASGSVTPPDSGTSTTSTP